MNPAVHITMGPGAEFDAVRALLAQWGTAAQGVGDDGAVLDVPQGSRLVVSTDTSVEGVHFRRAWLSPAEIGYRATQAALSDLAAMGAAPLGVLLALTVPERWRSELPSLAEGIAEATREAQAPIVGGDVTDGDRLALGITVLGHAARPLARSGARPGDVLYVTGALGGPGAALAAWERDAPHADADVVSARAGSATENPVAPVHPPAPEHRARFARPRARLAAGQWLAAHGATAAIDLSDGLAGDVAHLAAASGVRCVLDLGAVPTVAGVSVDDALASGEEYELLVAAPALDVTAFAAAHHGLTLTAIGRVESAHGPGDVVAERDGRPVALPSAHDHFAR
jgi:thiamine-monophosphate kinase